MSEFNEANRNLRANFPNSAAGYLSFINDELEMAAGAIFFQVHHPAPSDMTHEQLEVVAADLRAIGWNAEVAPLEAESENAQIGIRIRSDD